MLVYKYCTSVCACEWVDLHVIGDAVHVCCVCISVTFLHDSTCPHADEALCLTAVAGHTEAVTLTAAQWVPGAHAKRPQLTPVTLQALYICLGHNTQTLSNKTAICSPKWLVIIVKYIAGTVLLQFSVEYT